MSRISEALLLKRKVLYAKRAYWHIRDKYQNELITEYQWTNFQAVRDHIDTEYMKYAVIGRVSWSIADPTCVIDTLNYFINRESRA